MRARSAVVIIEKGRVALIQRIWNDSIYYVFPGGGIEEGENPKEAAQREALEELGVYVTIYDCISRVVFDGHPQYFFLAEIIAGTIGTGRGEEYTDTTRGRGLYTPVWVDIRALSSMDVRPLEVVLNVQSLSRETGFY